MINISVKKAGNIWQKTRGLIAKEKIEPILIQTHFGIHTFGVKLPIDVIILDTSNNVVKLRENLLPNRLFFWNPKYSKVLELPAGTIANYKITLNQQIAFD